MDTGRIPRDLWKSVRIAWTDERWLFAGTAIAAVAFPLWVGATGGAVSTITDFAGVSLALDVWTGTTTAVAAVLGLLWFVGPAALATYLVVDRLTNARGNLNTCYRLGHPVALLALPVGALAIGVGAALAAGIASPPIQAVLVAAGVYVAIRTTAYAYRVFALSLPPLASLVTFLTFTILGVTVLAGAAGAVGRAGLVADVAAGIADLSGVDGVADVGSGVVTVAGVDLPVLVAAAVATPVGLSGAYVALQVVVGSIQRVRKPTVKRSSLRTGQRYPAFAHPTAQSGGTARSSGTTAGSSPSSAGTVGESTEDGGESTTDASERTDDVANPVAARASTAPSKANASDESAVADGADDDAGSDVEDADDVSHTRVFTPDEGAEMDFGTAGGPTDGFGGPSALVCSSCDETYDADLDRSFCPTCGSELRPE